jgi:DNA-binding CsgD family transcriptional regulator
LARQGARRDRAHGPARFPRDELTAPERRVAELAATGLSNQEIAQRAFLSVKTVEANLTRAYRKLGVHSRSGLAGALVASKRHQ